MSQKTPRPIDLLTMYRDSAPPFMRDVATEFQQLTPSEQRELLFWMVVDASTNPTTIRSQNVQPGTAGNA